MKKFLMKYSSTLSVMALFVTTYASNRCCFILFHQPELPKSAKKLRKF